ncbi:hypothetical protein I4U23_018096 [Adineta vaga]|nr:hypothetical protein I4U23_018096 [Adineta vaga]
MDDYRTNMIYSYTDLNTAPRSDITTDPLSILLEARFEPCQVCGEQSSGLHCDAITCEACKKFFLRSINGEDLKYKCVRNKDCLITRNTRTQCQYCRFQKCKSVGMTVKGSEIQQTPRVADIFAQISCYVCQASSSGIHFGAITCEGCKGFFRRSIKERAPSRYKCMDNGTCEISASTRNGCRYCRFQRCIRVGMSVEGSRIGRQSNLFKHHMRMMLQRNDYISNTTILHQMTQSVSTSITRHKRSNARRTVSESSSSESELTQSTLTIIDYENQLDRPSRDLISTIFKAYKETFENFPICSKYSTSWLSCMNQFKNYANHSVKFATRIPGFMNLQNVTDQVQLVKSSIHSLIILCSQRSIHSSSWNYFNITDINLHDECQQLFPFIENIRSDVEKIHLYISSLKLDDKEFSLVLSLLIISTSNIYLSDFLLIDSTQTELTCALCDYMDCKRGRKSQDFYTVMFLLPTLRKLNTIIQEQIKNQIPKNMTYPAFFSRVYLNEQDTIGSLMNNQSNSFIDE